MSTILFSVFSSNFAPSRRCWLLPRTWSHLWFAGVRECPLWCSIFGATVTVHQFFCILCFCHTCSLCHVELVVQFPTRGLTQVLLCLFPGVLWLWHFLYSVGPHPVSSLYIYTFVVSRAFMAGECWRWLLPGTWSHLWFAGVRECPPWCSVVGATVTVHHFTMLPMMRGWLGGQRSKVKVIIEGSKNNFVNRKKLKLSLYFDYIWHKCCSRWEDWTLLISEVKS